MIRHHPILPHRELPQAIALEKFGHKPSLSPRFHDSHKRNVHVNVTKQKLEENVGIHATIGWTQVIILFLKTIIKVGALHTGVDDFLA